MNNNKNYDLSIRPVGLQETGEDEHASGCGRKGPLHQHPLRLGQGQPQHLYQVINMTPGLNPRG